MPILIIQFLNQSISYYYVNNFVFSKKITLNKTPYLIEEESLINEGFIGFFDWLRKTEHNIIGVRMFFFDYNKHINLFKTHYVSIMNNKSMDFFFTNDKAYNPNLSDDQDFTNNYIYRSNNAEYLLIIGLDNLTTAELKGVSEHVPVITLE